MAWNMNLDVLREPVCPNDRDIHELSLLSICRLYPFSTFPCVFVVFAFRSVVFRIPFLGYLSPAHFIDVYTSCASIFDPAGT